MIEGQVRVSSRTYTKIEINTKWSRQSHVLVAIWQLKREQVYVSLTLIYEIQGPSWIFGWKEYFFNRSLSRLLAAMISQKIFFEYKPRPLLARVR